MGIPVSPNAFRTWTDPDTGVTYRFRYLLGEHQEEYLSLKNSAVEAAKSFIPQATREITAENKSKKLTADKKNQLITRRAFLLAQDKIESAEAESLRYARRLVNIFLCGWEGKNLPEFPKGGNPSDYLTIGALNVISVAIGGMSAELCGLSVDESKN